MKLYSQSGVQGCKSPPKTHELSRVVPLLGRELKQLSALKDRAENFKFERKSIFSTTSADFSGIFRRNVVSVSINDKFLAFAPVELSILCPDDPSSRYYIF